MPMKRMTWIVAVLAAIVGAFLLGRYTAGAPDKVSGAASPVAGAGNARDADERLPRSDAPATDADDRAVLPAASPTAPAGDAGAPGRDMQASGGPRSLLEEDLPRLDRAETMMGADGGTTSDLLDLAKNEEQDDGAHRLEQLLVLALRRHGDGYTQLRLSPPHCTRSVCMLRGIGADGATLNPRSDWQRLSGAIMSEPWFREVFDDMRGFVTHDKGEAIYITLYVRCEPGTCRHGSR
jgi:hypothetical protein